MFRIHDAQQPVHEEPAKGDIDAVESRFQQLRVICMNGSVEGRHIVLCVNNRSSEH